MTPVYAVTVYLNGMYGPERADNDSDPRAMLDLAAIWKATNHVTLGVNVDSGSERNAVTPGRTASWNGIAGYARVAVSGPFSLILRGEYFADPDGARTGQSQYLAETTLTPELRVTPRLLLPADHASLRQRTLSLRRRACVSPLRPSMAGACCWPRAPMREG